MLLSQEDGIYLGLLCACIIFGPVYRSLSNDRVNQKRWVGTIVGLVLIAVVSGYHTIHVILAFAVATMIVLSVDAR